MEIHSFILSCNKLLSAYSVAGTVLGKASALMGLMV